MSWPQWPNAVAQPVGAASTIMPAGVTYTPEQWAQMQQQNWQQWAQWQQQYQQWHQQYGAEFQKSMNALNANAGITPPTTATVQTAMVATIGQPPLPPLDKPPLPPPDEPPQPVIQPPLIQNQYNMFTAPPPLVNYNTSVPPPKYNQAAERKIPQNYNNRQNELQNYNQQQNISQQASFNNRPSWQNQGNNRNNFSTNQKPNNEQNKRPFAPVSQPLEPPKRAKFESEWQQKPEQAWDGTKATQNKPNSEELSEAEKKFDKQFADWEAQFNKWKEQNAGHPDKEQYKEYEKKWETWRTQLLERREQMRRKRLSLAANKASPIFKTSLNNNPNQQVPQKSNEILEFKFNQQEKTDTNDDGGFLKSVAASGGIPGLDLVRDDKETKQDKPDVIDLENSIRKDDKTTNLEAISKGISSILGDQKLLNMLSLVSQGQNFNINSNNSTNKVSTPSESSFVPPPNDSSYQSYDNQSNQGGDDYYSNHHENVNNFDDQTRSSFTVPPNNDNDKEDVNNTIQDDITNLSGNFNDGSGSNNRFPSFNNRFNQDFRQQNFRKSNEFNRARNADDNFNNFRDKTNVHKSGINFRNNDFNNTPQNSSRENDFESTFPARESNVNNFHGRINDCRNNFRSSNNFRGPEDKFKASDDKFRGLEGFKTPQEGFRGPKDNFRPSEDNFRSSEDGLRTPDCGFRNSDFRGPKDSYRGPEENVKSGIISNRNSDPGSNNNFRSSGNINTFNNKRNDFNKFDKDMRRGERSLNFEPPPSWSDKYVDEQTQFNETGHDLDPKSIPVELKDKLPADEIRDNILKPSNVIDYDHKSLKPVEPEISIEPRHTFDYRHKPLNRIPLPQRPKWLNEAVKNIHEFNPLVTRPYEQLRRYPSNSDRYDNYRVDERRKTDDYFDDRHSYGRRGEFYDRRKVEDKRFDDNRRSYEEPRYNSHKDQDDRYRNDKKFRENVNRHHEEAEISTSPLKSNMHVNLIEDLLNAPGRFKRPPRIVIILRGPPGSGKTFLAKLIKDKEVENGGSAPRILSLDDYFMVEQEKEVVEDGKRVKIKDMVYEYEENMEATYRTSLMKSFKKTITDGLFSFIIVDNVNDKVKYFGEMWSFAKQNGFQVYVCQLELDVQTCSKRNIHGRTEAEIEKCVAGWEQTPVHHPILDATSLIQSGSIAEVEMEEINSPSGDELDDGKEEEQAYSSKWDNFDCSVDNLAKLDGTSKPLRPSRTMEDYLQLEDWAPSAPSKPGQKRVRWADLEECKEQEKMRAIGFVVGQTDWNRMMDPTMGSGALTQTKYIERSGRY